MGTVQLYNMSRLVTLGLFFVLCKVTGECGFTGDCSAGDFDYACPGDCSLFVKCSNGDPTIMSCSGGTFFDESLDQCVWTCPWGDTTTTPPPPPTTTTTNIPENCDTRPCRYGTDGPEFYRIDGSCSEYIRCDFGLQCIHSCKWGLIFDNRSTELVKPGCKLPPLAPNCLDPVYQVDSEVAKYMKRSSVILDVEKMNSPMCTFLGVESCEGEEIFQPVYDYGPRGGHCTKEFKICYNGWSCFMRCDEGLVLDIRTRQCVPKTTLEYLC